MKITAGDTALVLTDPQNDFLSPQGVTWELVGKLEQKMHAIGMFDRPGPLDLKVVLAGMCANLCIESHLRELLEQGFEVAVVADATAAAQHPEMGDGDAAALTSFRSSAGAVLTADETVAALATDSATQVTEWAQIRQCRRCSEHRSSCRPNPDPFREVLT